MISSGFRSPCEHGGTCVNTPGSFRCDCVQGFEGERCDQDIKECASNPCKNDATCLDHRGYYECVCMPGKSQVIRNRIRLLMYVVPVCNIYLKNIYRGIFETGLKYQPHAFSPINGCKINVFTLNIIVLHHKNLKRNRLSKEINAK